MRVEVLEGAERRRRWSNDEKMRIVAETLQPGDTPVVYPAVGVPLNSQCRG
jgi:transposase-like protein